jgi:hypothetical protein
MVLDVVRTHLEARAAEGKRTKRERTKREAS